MVAVWFPFDPNRHTTVHLVRWILDTNDVGEQPRSFVQINPSNHVRDVLAKEWVVALTDNAVTVDLSLIHI